MSSKRQVLEDGTYLFENDGSKPADVLLTISKGTMDLNAGIPANTNFNWDGGNVSTNQEGDFNFNLRVDNHQISINENSDCRMNLQENTFSVNGKSDGKNRTQAFFNYGGSITVSLDLNGPASNYSLANVTVLSNFSLSGTLDPGQKIELRLSNGAAGEFAMEST